MAKAIANGADLEFAADAAVAQRVSPLLWRALGDIDVDLPDEPWVERLRADAARCLAQSRLLLPRLGELMLQPLADSGLEPLVMKGFALAERYPDPALRPMDDIDLVFPPTQAGAVIATLQRAGWQVRPVPASRPHETDLLHPALPGLPIDLHRELTTWRDRTTRLTGDALWRLRRRHELAGAPAYILPPEYELVSLAAHAAKPFHTFDRLIWSVDVCVVVETARASGGFDWDIVREFAAENACRTAVAVALSHARRLGLDVPADMLEGGAGGTRRSALAPVLSSQWPLVPRKDKVRMPLMFALIDDWRSRVEVLVGVIGVAGPLEGPRRAVQLPARGARRWWRLRSGRSAPVEDGSYLGEP